MLPTDAGQECIGWVFASPGSDGVDQKQRWLLFPDRFPLPKGDVTLKRPTPIENLFQSLEEWKGAVRSLWKDGSTYVKVDVTSYDHIPDRLQSAPSSSAAYDTRRYQLIDEFAILPIGWERQPDLAGVCTSGGPTERMSTNMTTSTESWVTDAGYRLDVSDTLPRLRFEVISSLSPVQDVLQHFADGSALSIAKCTNYSGWLPQDLLKNPERLLHRKHVDPRAPKRPRHLLGEQARALGECRAFVRVRHREQPEHLHTEPRDLAPRRLFAEQTRLRDEPPRAARER